MAERVRHILEIVFLAAAAVSAILVPLSGISPVPGLIFLTLFLVATAAKPEPGSRTDDDRRDPRRQPAGDGNGAG